MAFLLQSKGEGDVGLDVASGADGEADEVEGGHLKKSAGGDVYGLGEEGAEDVGDVTMVGGFCPAEGCEDGGRAAFSGSMAQRDESCVVGVSVRVYWGVRRTHPRRGRHRFGIGGGEFNTTTGMTEIGTRVS